MSLLTQLLLWHGALCFSVVQGADDGPLHLVDVTALVCSAATTEVFVTMAVPASAAGKAHVVSLWRTNPEPVRINFELYALSSGKKLIEPTTVSLSNFSHMPNTNPQRRLSARSDLSGNCEDFFLIDGRMPVELPDTWGEARDAFRGMCEQEGGTAAACRQAEELAFKGYPRSQDQMAADAGLCARLMKHAAIFMPEVSQGIVPLRRLKGGGGYSTSGGSAAAGSFSSKSVSGYGFSTGRMSSQYPSGYASPSYGYAGRGARLPGGRTTMLPVVAGVAAGATVGTFVGWRMSRGSTYGRNADTNGDGCTESDPCEWQLQPGEDLTRDDLMTLGFTAPSGNVRLKVYSVIGEPYAASRICPPFNWTDENPGSWQPPLQQDIFASLAPVDSVTWVEEEEVDPMAIGIPAALGLIFAGCFIYFLRGSKHKRTWLRMRKERAGKQGDNYSGAVPAGLHFQYVSLTDKDMQATRAYTLQVQNNGTVTGSTHSDGYAICINGVLRWHGSSAEVWWNESADGYDAEVYGALFPAPGQGWTLKATVWGGEGPKLNHKVSGTLLANNGVTMNQHGVVHDGSPVVVGTVIGNQVEGQISVGKRMTE